MASTISCVDSGMSSTNFAAKKMGLRRVDDRSRENVPGEPAKNDSAGMTVFGGTTVLSAILAQSLMIVNLPCRILEL